MSADTDGPVFEDHHHLRKQAIRGATLLSVRQIVVGTVMFVGVFGLPLLLTPAEFSLYGYVNTTVLVGAAIGDLGLGAYLIRNTVEDRHMSASLGLQLIFWSLTCLLLLTVALTINPFDFEPVTNILLIGSLYLFSLQALPTALLEKQMRFGTISTVEISQRVILVAIALVLALTDPSEWTIPVAAAVAAIAGYPAIMVVAKWRWRPRLARGEPIFRGFSSEWWQVKMLNQAAYAAYPLLGGLLFGATEVGYIVWAVAITTIPAYLAPMIARATFPAMARSQPENRAAIYSSLFKGLLVIGAPLITVLLVSAEPFTKNVFGPEWLDAVPLLRLESLTSLLGIALPPLVPLMFLTFPEKWVKRAYVAQLAAMLTIAVFLAPTVSFLALSISSLITHLLLLIIFDRMLHRKIGYSPIRDMLPASVGVLFGVGVGLAITLSIDSIPGAAVGAAVAAATQLGVTWILGGGVRLGAIAEQIRVERSVPKDF